MPGVAMARLAERAERAADDVLRERSRLGSAAIGMGWKSAAATSFAHRAQAGQDTLRADGEALRELAALLRRHGRQVEEHLQVLADVARRAELIAEQGVEAVGDTAAATAGAVSDGVSAAGGAVSDGVSAAGGAVSDGVSGTGHAVESAGHWLGERAPW